MNTIWRGVLAVVLGFVTLGVTGMIAEMIGHVIFPPPAGLDLSDPAAIGKLPIGALVSVLMAWALATFAAAWVAARVAAGGQLAFGLSMGILGLVAAIATMLMIPHPTWMWILGIAEFLPAAYLGAKLAAPRASPAAGRGVIRMDRYRRVEPQAPLSSGRDRPSHRWETEDAPVRSALPMVGSPEYSSRDAELSS